MSAPGPCIRAASSKRGFHAPSSCPGRHRGRARCNRRPGRGPAPASCHPGLPRGDRGRRQAPVRPLQPGLVHLEPRRGDHPVRPQTLLATVSDAERTTPEKIREYLVQFLKGEPVARIDSSTITIACDIAIRSGNWTVVTRNAVGERVDVPARYTFVYKWDGKDWRIHHLHSSVRPAPVQQERRAPRRPDPVAGAQDRGRRVNRGSRRCSCRSRGAARRGQHAPRG